MDVAVISADLLFLDGLVAILEADGRFDVVKYGDRIRDTVRSAALGQGDAVVVDVSAGTERDLDYLVGAQEFGGFRTVLISDGEIKVADQFAAHLSRLNRGSELVRTVIGEEIAQAQSTLRNGSPQPAQEAPPAMKNSRGRPREFTNSLPISTREYQAAVLIARGQSYQEIADAMGLKVQSVKNLTRMIAHKLECEGRMGITECLRRASVV